MVFCFINITQKDPKIQQPLVQPLTHVHGVSADDVKENARIALLELMGCSCDLPYPVGFARADINIPADGFVRLGDLLFRPAFQLLQLAGEGGLRQVQGLGRRRDVLLSGHSQEVLQYSQFHRGHLLMAALYLKVSIVFKHNELFFIGICY